MKTTFFLCLTLLKLCLCAFDLENDIALQDFNRNITNLRLLERPVPLQIRITAITPSVAWDAIAPYTENGLGIQVDAAALRRPASERTNTNKNIATIYALYHFASAIQPQDRKVIDDYMARLGLDPTNVSMDTSSPVGIGNHVGRSWVFSVYNEGINQLGNIDSDGTFKLYNRRNYSDTTGYKPVNSINQVFDLDRWQPFVESINDKWIIGQTFVVPQLGFVPTFANLDVESLVNRIPDPISFKNNPILFRLQMWEVIRRSAQLDDRRKMLAEYFDSKRNVPDVIRPLLTGGFDIDRYTKVLLITGQATYDAMKVMWRAKGKFDTVRPFTVVHTLKKNDVIRSWGGPGVGPVFMHGQDWAAYIRSDAFPEYPSATTCLFHSLGQATRFMAGNGSLPIDDDYPINIHFKQGSSKIEPGITPSQDITITFNSIAELEEASAESRIDAGVHFRPAVENIQSLCRGIGEGVFRRHQRLMNGEPLF
jgi:hypothetical protein